MINREIYDLVQSHEGCKWGLGRLSKSKSAAEMIRLLKTPKGVEFAMQQDFLPLAILEKYRSLLEAENIYFDGEHTVVNPRFALIFGGKVTIELSDFQVSELYVKNASVTVIAKDYAFVTIEESNAEVAIEQYDKSRVREFLK